MMKKRSLFLLLFLLLFLSSHFFLHGIHYQRSHENRIRLLAHDCTTKIVGTDTLKDTGCRPIFGDHHNSESVEWTSSLGITWSSSQGIRGLNSIYERTFVLELCEWIRFMHVLY